MPVVNVSQTFTDNYDISRNGGSDSITQGSVGLRLSGIGSRVRGSLDYSLTQSLYARHSDKNDRQNTLSGVGSVELIDDWAYVDASASVAQQQISAFGPTSADSGLSSSNSTELRTFTVSPYARGRIGAAQYEVRANQSVSRSGSFGAANRSTTGASAMLSGGDARRTSGWSVVASTQTIDYDKSGSARTDMLRGTLAWPVTSSLSLTGIAGVERNDVRTPTLETSAIRGAQLDWVPSERTQLSARLERRYFGDSHAVSFSYRTPRTVWTFVDTRDVSTGAGERGATTGNVYDLLYQQFASVQPDPVQRDLLVRTFLAQYGLDPNTTVIPGFLSTAPLLQRSQSLSFGLIGIRSNLVFQATRTSSEQVRRATDTGDDFARSANIRQQGFTVSWSHRLTPQSSMNVAASWQQTEGDLSAQQNRLRRLDLGWSTTLSRELRASLGTRYVQSRGGTPYTERAVFGSLGYQF